MSYLSELHGSIHQHLHGIQGNQIHYTTFTVVSRLTSLDIVKHLLLVSSGYRSMVPNYISYNDGVVFKISTSHKRGEVTVESIKTSIADNSLLSEFELVDLMECSGPHETEGFSIQKQFELNVVSISLFSDDHCKVDSVDASFTEELMPEQVSNLVAAVEKLDKPDDEKSVTVIATYIRREDGRVLSLFKYIAGHLDSAESPHMSNQTSAIRTIHLNNNILNERIMQHCEETFLVERPAPMAKKWRTESLLFVVSCSQPMFSMDEGCEFEDIKPDEHSGNDGSRLFCYAHPDDPDFNFDIQEPASPTNTTINLGKGRRGRSFKDAGSTSKDPRESEVSRATLPTFRLKFPCMLQNKTTRISSVQTSFSLS